MRLWGLQARRWGGADSGRVYGSFRERAGSVRAYGSFRESRDEEGSPPGPHDLPGRSGATPSAIAPRQPSHHVSHRTTSAIAPAPAHRGAAPASLPLSPRALHRQSRRTASLRPWDSRATRAASGRCRRAVASQAYGVRELPYACCIHSLRLICCLHSLRLICCLHSF